MGVLAGLKLAGSLQNDMRSWQINFVHKICSKIAVACSCTHSEETLFTMLVKIVSLSTHCTIRFIKQGLVRF